MAPPIKKRKLNDVYGLHSNGDDGFDHSPLTPATSEDRANWRGFCEIESNPVSDSNHQQVEQNEF